MLIGSHILDFFGISIPVVQIRGGLVVMSTGWALLKSDGESPPDEEMGRKLTPQDIADRAFYPLTLPLTVGPGSISVARPTLDDVFLHATGRRLEGEDGEEVSA